MTDEEFAQKISKSDLWRNYSENNKNTTDKISDALHNTIVLPNMDKNNNFFQNMFEGTGYLAKGNCTYAVSLKGGDKTEKLLCNFVAWIEKEVAIDDGLETHNILKIKGKHQNGDDLPSIDVSENDFQSMNWIIKKWGVKCILEPRQSTKDSVRHCIQMISKNIKSETVFKHTGWRNHSGKWIYLHSGGSVGGDNIKVRLDGKLKKYCLPSRCDNIKSGLCDALNELENLAPKKIIYPLLAYTYLTPLNEFLKQAGFEPNFVFFLMGKTGSGKSTLSALFLSFFGNFSGTDLPFSFMDTPNAIINSAFALKDNLICVDDYKPSLKGDMNKMDNTAQQILRAVGERTGRQRLNSDSTVMKQRYPRCNVIITGEQSPNVGESGNARQIIVEITQGDINWEMMTKAQKSARNGVYAKIMRGFVEYIQNSFLNGGEKAWVDILRAEFENLRAIWRQKTKGIAHPRIPSTLAFLQISFKCFLKFCKSCGLLGETSARERMDSFINILKSIANEHSKFLSEDKPALKFIRALGGMIASGAVKFENVGTSLNADKNSNILVGYYDDNYYYFIPGVAYNQVCSFYSRQGENFATNSRTLLKALADEGLIKTTDGRNTINCRINGKQGRYICFYKEKFNNFEGISNKAVTEVTQGERQEN